jgi:hypothetical protein
VGSALYGICAELQECDLSRFTRVCFSPAPHVCWKTGNGASAGPVLGSQALAHKEIAVRLDIRAQDQTWDLRLPRPKHQSRQVPLGQMWKSRPARSGASPTRARPNSISGTYRDQPSAGLEKRQPEGAALGQGSETANADPRCCAQHAALFWSRNAMGRTTICRCIRRVAPLARPCRAPIRPAPPHTPPARDAAFGMCVQGSGAILFPSRKEIGTVRGRRVPRHTKPFQRRLRAGAAGARVCRTKVTASARWACAV